MHVIETVPRNNDQRMIDPWLADGIIINAENSGHKIIREWSATEFVVKIMWPRNPGKVMLMYRAPTH